MYPNMESAVQAGADAMADLEEYARDQAKASADTVRQVLDFVHDAGKIGDLEHAALGMEITAIVANFRTQLYVFHSKVTLRCQELGIDLPDQRDGGNR